MHHGVISSCQSAASSEILTRFWSDTCKQRYSKYLTFTFTFTYIINTDDGSRDGDGDDDDTSGGDGGDDAAGNGTDVYNALINKHICICTFLYVTSPSLLIRRCPILRFLARSGRKARCIPETDIELLASR